MKIAKITIKYGDDKYLLELIDGAKLMVRKEMEGIKNSEYYEMASEMNIIKIEIGKAERVQGELFNY
jgi:hypothetical protein